ncbi:MAG TPA: Gldg family protein [Tepidisphaeraceae bacterium]|nr:Gldg family protein [Tepidisphaeraceae bacterium]
MSEAQKPRAQKPMGPETQSERWAKYGANVVLMVVLAIVLAGLVTYIAEAHDWRVDTTAAGVNSLKPQTRNVLRDLNSDIKLVSLYSKNEATDSSTRGRTLDRSAMVADLLDNYARASKHVTVEVIDPNDNAKVSALQTDLDNRYGGKDIRQYKDYIEQYDKVAGQLADLISHESGKVTALVAAEQGKTVNDEVGPQIRDGYNKMDRSLENNRADVKRHLQEHRPNYRGITDTVRSTLEAISASEKNILTFFEKNKDNAQLYEPVRKYMAEGLAANQQIQKQADDEIAKIGKLGELKVDELQQAMDVPNPILVLGPTTWRVLSETQVWPSNNASRSDADGKLLPEFAGEQQITAAIIGLTSPTKPKVVFLRPGGGPLTNPGVPLFQPPGPLADISERLRQYNFDVLEKDMSGTYAMQAQMQGQPAPPEPSWDDIKDAVWVVLDVGRAPQGTEPVGPKLAEHLGHGGSAMVLWNPPGPNTGPAAGDPFQPILAGWGVDIHPDMLAVHELTAPPPNAGMDPFQDFLRRPYVWDLRQYGDAELAKPIQNLESLMILMGPTTTHSVSGYTVQNLMPLPDAPAAPKSWGAKNYQDLLSGTASAPVFNKDQDLPGPLYGGPAVEKKGGGRLVVVGCIEFLINDLLEARDESIAHNEGRWVARFPGNGELAMNSIFWLSKMDSLIALSPAALQVSRISNMSDVTLGFWRIGVFLILLPLGVVVSGIGVYFARRD